jgi:hypothetical protein
MRPWEHRPDDDITWELGCMHFGQIVEYYKAHGDLAMMRRYIMACWWGRPTNMPTRNEEAPNG